MTGERIVPTPVGKIEVGVTYLEMTAPPERAPIPAPTPP